MFQELAVGETYPLVEGRREGVFFDIRYPTVELIYNMRKPTKREIEQVAAGRQFEIRAIELNEVIFVTTRFGTLQWMDSPYDPRLGDCQLDAIEPGTKGYGMWFLLTDSPSGTIRHLRLIGLGHGFSSQFRDLVYANKAKDIAVDEHDRRVRELYARYTSREIAELSSLRYRLKAAEQ